MKTGYDTSPRSSQPTWVPVRVTTAVLGHTRAAAVPRQSCGRAPPACRQGTLIPGGYPRGSHTRPPRRLQIMSVRELRTRPSRRARWPPPRALGASAAAGASREADRCGRSHGMHHHLQLQLVCPTLHQTERAPTTRCDANTLPTLALLPRLARLRAPRKARISSREDNLWCLRGARPYGESEMPQVLRCCST